MRKRVDFSPAADAQDGLLGHHAALSTSWTSTIRSLTPKNPQNVPIPEFTSSDLYKDVINDTY